MTLVGVNHAMEVVVEAVDGLALGFVVESRKGGAHLNFRREKRAGAGFRNPPVVGRHAA